MESVNQFEKLPDELLALLFSFVPIKGLGNLLSVCKRFNSFLTDNQALWRPFCNLNYWNKKFDLAWVVKEVSIRASWCNWMWFAQCFANQRQEGPSWHLGPRLDNRTFVRIGPMKGGLLHGWGIVIVGEKAFCFGKFVEGHLSSGYKIHEEYSYVGELNINYSPHGKGISESYGTIYNGDWKDGRWWGQGILSWHSGANYSGGFEDFKCSGFGTLTYPDGFSFSCEWKDNSPPDEEIYIHPKIIECIQQGKCTKQFNCWPQWSNMCITCRYPICLACWNTCHIENHRYYTEWDPKSFCECECQNEKSNKKHRNH